MTVSPLVSIVIPSYNAGRWLEATLATALEQTHSPCEVIVVDDGSTDDSLALAQRFRARGVVVVPQLNRGASAARNRALSVAQGEYIQFLDADDLLAPDKIERQLALLHSRGDGFVAACEWVRFTSEPPEGPLTPQPTWRDMSAVDFLVTCAMEELMFPPIAWLIPRTLCERAGRWDEEISLNDDGEYMSRVLAASDGIVFATGARAYYRSGNPGSYASQRSCRAAESELRAWDRIVATMVKLENTPRVRLAAATGYQRIEAAWIGRCDGVMERAALKEREFGGGGYRFDGGPLFRSAVRLVGWKPAMRLRRWKEAAHVRLRG
jgi:glycosyltransferase involved in cell wall biosynthesis